MRPAPVGRARVLEVGCASGGNLIPMAVGLPDATFVGFDRSERQVNAARQTVAALGLTNVRVEHLDVRDVTRELGTFDYVVCHGVYSWVARDVQDHILRFCQECLAPNGVVYVSYNTYPGWHMRGIVRDVMLYHAKQFADPIVRVRQARNLLDFLSQSVTQQDDPYSLLLKQEVEVIRQSRDAYLYHDHLEDENNPVYFHQFAERAAAAGLQYLGEVEFRVMLAGNYPPEVRSVLQTLSPDGTHLEQYMDFLRNRMFRQTLLCHRGVPLVPQVKPELLAGLAAASPVRPEADPLDVRSTATDRFLGLDGSAVTTREPVLKAALVHLRRAWPQAVPFGELLAAARDLNGSSRSAADDGRALAEGLLSCYASASESLVELHTGPFPFVREPGDRPTASPLARRQAADGSNWVTNLRHEAVGLNNVDRLLLPYLDGTRDRGELAEVVVELARKGEYSVKQQDQPVTDPPRVRELAGPVVADRLAHLGANALLVS